ncbi:hypothetical protein TNCV_52891 [Trichonephila clavipes]|nr:hypothetical protein TNCV_52891 [Trichonephila clavipes]
MTPELTSPILTTTPHQREDVSALDRFNVHHSLTWRVFSGTGIEHMTYQPLNDTLTTGLPHPQCIEGLGSIDSSIRRSNDSWELTKGLSLIVKKGCTQRKYRL